MRISIFGSGYVGLVTGACLAELGNEVICCDIDEAKILKLTKGEVPFYEPGLQEVVSRNIGAGRLTFTSQAEEAIIEQEIIFIAVSTPSLQGGQADTSAVLAVAKKIGELLTNDRAVVVSKSTVPLGTNKLIKQIILEGLEKRNLKLNFAIASNPEFLRQGRAVEDFMVPDRIVVGVEEEWARNIMGTLYAPLTKNNHPIFFTDIASSEMSKYAANTFIASRISLMNELSQICEAVGADVEVVRQILGSDHRIGNKYIYPGLGYGGSCFPKDVQALANMAKNLNIDATLVNAIENVNLTQKTLFANKIAKELNPLKAKTIAIWGLSFKPNTDDMRSAPAIDIINILLQKGASIKAFDPVAMEAAKTIFGGKIQLAKDMYEALSEASALVLITEWAQFKEPDFEKIKSLLKSPIIFDGRNIYDPLRMKELGFSYTGIGRRRV